MRVRSLSSGKRSGPATIPRGWTTSEPALVLEMQGVSVSQTPLKR